MKTIFTRIFLAVILIVTTISCDEIDELTQVDIETTLTEEFTITFNSMSDTFTETVILDLSEDEELANNLDRIEDIEIREAFYTLTNYQGDAGATASLSVEAAGEIFGPFIHDYSADTLNGTAFNLTGADRLTIVSERLENTNQLSITFNGTQDPAQTGSVDIILTIALDVTAQAL